ncbi:MAG: hypothetical protein V4605_08885 [Pseudomonadota bacterium]
MFKTAAEFITKNQTLILAAGAVFVGWYVIKKLTPSGALSEKLSTLGQGLLNPLDALAANIGILPKNTSSAQLTPSFQKYIDDYGGIEKYLRDHKNGTFRAPTFNGVTGGW